MEYQYFANRFDVTFTYIFRHPVLAQAIMTNSVHLFIYLFEKIFQFNTKLTEVGLVFTHHITLFNLKH